uniref:CCHC-type domain-containing protein n=1 Tax=Ananas comosus var. bracteatus TaxID=296719 RepID=A0A6V7QAA3_ANACO|nr:unnamed protein product [Ananas comosus var. bracteatus]
MYPLGDEVGEDLLAICREYEVENEKLPALSKSSIRGKQSDLNEAGKDEKFKKNQLHGKISEVGEPKRGGELWRVSSCNDEDERRFHATGRGSTKERSRDYEAEKGKLPAFSKSSVRGNLRDLKEDRRDDKLKKKQQHAKSFEVGEPSRGGELRRVSSCNEDDEKTFHVSGKGSTLERRGKDLSARRSRKRCFRCLATDHTVAVCRDPVRCLRCWRIGHRAKACREIPGLSKGAMNRAANIRGRAPQHKVFVPYTEEYLRQIELRRNAILADVIEPANLGPEPITVIKTALASRFGGYTEDFAVARCRERDYAIFLPDWVPADVLIRRQILTLNGFWLRCWPWGRHRDVRPHRVLYKAWIRLINFPFEIWSVARVAALVSSFGRFIKADNVTKAMTDLQAFRCQIALDSIYNIPQNLSVIVGEELFPVMVHLERWERADVGGVDAPPAPPRDGDGNGGERADDRNHGRQKDGNRANEDEAMEDAPGELEEAETNQSTIRVLRTRPLMWAGLAAAARRAVGSEAARREAGSAAARRAAGPRPHPVGAAAVCRAAGLRGAADTRWGWVATGRSRPKIEAK